MRNKQPQDPKLAVLLLLFDMDQQSQSQSVLLLAAETFFVKHIWNIFSTYVYHLCYIYILYAFMFSLTNISGTVCSKKRHFEYILKTASICHVYLWKHLQISSLSRTIFPYLVTRGFTATNWREFFLGKKRVVYV